MQETRHTKKIIRSFVYNMVLKKDTRSGTNFTPGVYLNILSKIIRRVVIVQPFGRKGEKVFLFFDCKRNDDDNLDHFFWDIHVKLTPIITDEFNWNTGMKSRNGYVVKLIRDMSLVLVERLMEIFMIIIQLFKH